MKLLINIFAETLANRAESLKAKKPSFLAYSIDTFTNESWLEGVNRQGRMFTYETTRL